jgi:hypothetical protein
MRHRILAAAILLGACAAPLPSPPAPPPPPPPPVAQSPPSPEIRQRVEADRVRALELEVERLRADLRAAEQTLLAVESGMRGLQGRAEAVSALAEARVQVDRAARRAPWRRAEAGEARAKLAEAERQLGVNHVGSAVFFVSRAQRIAESLSAEADRVASDPRTHFVRGERVNLREGPSPAASVLATLGRGLPVFVENREGDWSLVRTATGRVGFVHSDLLAKR